MACFRRNGSIDRIGADALHPSSIALIYKRLARTAFAKGLLGTVSKARFEREVQTIPSHSIRVGVAPDNFAVRACLRLCRPTCGVIPERSCETARNSRSKAKQVRGWRRDLPIRCNAAAPFLVIGLH